MCVTVVWQLVGMFDS